MPKTENPNRPKPTPRKAYTIRLSKTGDEAVAAVARRDGITWSEASRRMLGYASVKMPAGWGAPTEFKVDP